MSKVKIIFYKGKGNWIDKIIRLKTRSPYSHCKIYLPEIGFSYSSSGMDGGVRRRKHTPNENWEEVDVDIDPTIILKFFEKTQGCDYDFMGILGFLIPFKDRTNEWFCSEWCSNVLKIAGDERMWLHEPSKLSPGKFYKILKEK